MRGYQSEDGRVPFYEGLGRHFFKADFNHVDELTGMGKKSFIAELMPRQPMYVDYLPQDARETIGRVHTNTVPARRLLEAEGMHFEGYVDIFDAGPVLQARITELRAMRESELVTVDLQARSEDTEPLIVSNTGMRDFRMILARANPVGGKLALTEQEREQLHCQAGEQVRTLTLNVRKK